MPATTATKPAPKTPAAKPPKKWPIHEFAGFLPPMNEGELDALRESIAVSGQVEPGWIFENKLLDARHRQIVMQEMGRELWVEPFKGTRAEALRFVYAKAVHRNLSPSQKAMAALRFLPAFEAEAKDRMLKGKAGVPQAFDGKTKEQWLEFFQENPGELIEHYNRHVLSTRHHKPAIFGLTRGALRQAMIDAFFIVHFIDDGKGTARDHVGRLLGVSGRLIQDAKLIEAYDGDLAAKVFRGGPSDPKLSRAKNLIRKAERKKKLKKLAKAAADVALGEIWTGDALVRMEEIPSGSQKLVIWDPPYNEGLDYGDGKAADSRSDKDYLAWITDMLDQVHRVLAVDGTLFIICSSKYQADIEIILRGNADIEGFHRRNVLAWHEAFGVHQRDNFAKCWRPILYYTKSATNYTFNGDAVLVPSARLEKYADKRANPEGKIPGNVLDVPRLNGTGEERYPDDTFKTQIPREITDLLTLVASDPGDTVFDPTCGSGTTIVSAACHGRKGLGIELNAKRADAARLRLKVEVAEHTAAKGAGK